MASRAQVTLAMEIMDYPLMNSISKALGYAHYLNNPWFQLSIRTSATFRPGITTMQMELQAGIGTYRGVHVKIRNPAYLKRAVRRRRRRF